MNIVSKTLNTVDALISQVLIDSYISHDKFFFVDNVLGEYDDTKGEVKSEVFKNKQKKKTMSLLKCIVCDTK